MAGALSQYANGLQGLAPIGIPDVNYYGAERYRNEPQPQANYSNTLNGLGSAFASHKAQQAQDQIDAGGGMGQTGGDFGATSSDAQGGALALAGGLLGMLGPAGAAANAMFGTSSIGSQAANGILGMLGFGTNAQSANEAASTAAAQAAVGDAMGGDHSGGSLTASDAAAATAANEAASADAAAAGAAAAGAAGDGEGGTGGVGGGYGGTSGSGDAGTGDGGGDGGGGDGGGGNYAKGGTVANKCLITKSSKGGAYEIKALADFKDKHMRDDPHLSHMADRLQDMAPSVIKHIDAMKDPDATYKHIHSKFIVPASRAITRKEHMKALHLYADLLDYVSPMASR